MTVTKHEIFFETEVKHCKVGHLLATPVKNGFNRQPLGAKTAPTVAAASLLAAEKYNKAAVQLDLAANYLISGEAFSHAVTKAYESAHLEKLRIFASKPASPETGLGDIDASGTEVCRFVEKSTIDKTEEYFKSANILGNSGCFCLTAGSMLEELVQHSPDLFRTTNHRLELSRRSEGDRFCQVELNSEEIDSAPGDSIDYAAMEKIKIAAERWAI